MILPGDIAINSARYDEATIRTIAHYIYGEEGFDPVVRVDRKAERGKPATSVVGVGHQLTPKEIESGRFEGERITERGAFDLLMEDTAKAYKTYMKTYGNENLEVNQMLALTSMIYQMGAGGVKGFKQMNAAISSDPPDYEEAARQIISGDHEGGKSLFFLQTQARALRTFYTFKGVDPEGNTDSISLNWKDLKQLEFPYGVASDEFQEETGGGEIAQGPAPTQDIAVSRPALPAPLPPTA